MKILVINSYCRNGRMLKGLVVIKNISFKESNFDVFIYTSGRAGEKYLRRRGTKTCQTTGAPSDRGRPSQAAHRGATKKGDHARWQCLAGNGQDS